MTDDGVSLTERARASAWVDGGDGLADTVAELEDAIGENRSNLVELAETTPRPGTISPTRAVRHLTAAGLSRAIRLGTRLPADLRDLKPLRDPQGWVRSAGVEAFADQLALGGAGTAEVARLIVGAGRLFPSELVDELSRRSIMPSDVERRDVERIVNRAFGDVSAIGERPASHLPITQLHHGRLSDGRSVGIRIRRPGVARQLVADSRLSSSVMSPLQQFVPQMGALHPIGFVQLTTRQNLEAIDLRFEGLNLVELGLVAEDMGLKGIRIVRPVAGHVNERVIIVESLDGYPLGSGRYRPDPVEGLAAVIALTIESALVHGVFWADPEPRHLRVDNDGRLLLVGTGNVGHLSVNLRHAGVLFLRSVLSGDAKGQVTAMRLAGAMTPETDSDALVADMDASEALKVATILGGGESGLLDALRETVRLLLRHQIRPPLEVILLLRTVFALGDIIDLVAPDSGGLTGALLPLVGRLPELIAEAEAAAAEQP